MSNLHTDYKTYHVYKNILIHKSTDNVTLCWQENSQLHNLMERCQNAHPNCKVWYELVSEVPYNNSNKCLYHINTLATVRIIYKENDNVYRKHNEGSISKAGLIRQQRRAMSMAQV